MITEKVTVRRIDLVMITAKVTIKRTELGAEGRRSGRAGARRALRGPWQPVH